MPKREPLYPHKPQKKTPRFPHVPNKEQCGFLPSTKAIEERRIDDLLYVIYEETVKAISLIGIEKGMPRPDPKDEAISGTIRAIEDWKGKSKRDLAIMPATGYGYYYIWPKQRHCHIVDIVVQRAGVGASILKLMIERANYYGVERFSYLKRGTHVVTRQPPHLQPSSPQSLPMSILEDLQPAVDKEVQLFKEVNMPKEPLYPHQPKRKAPQFPHEPKGSGSRPNTQDKIWHLGEWWEKEYSTADAVVYCSADGKKRLYAYWDGTKEVKPAPSSLPKTRSARIERIEEVTLSTGRAEITKLGRTYNFNLYRYGEDPQVTTGITLDKARELLAEAIRADVLEISPSAGGRVASVSRYEFFPESIRRRLPPLGATGEENDPVAQVKFFTPWTYWTWYGIEFDGKDIFFGWVVGLEKEFGSFSLAELQAVRGPAGLKIERDIHFEPKPMSQVMKEH